MNSEWVTTTIGNLVASGEAVVQTGPFGSQLHSHDYVEDGTPVIPTEAIGKGKILDIPVPKVSVEKANELARHRLRTGDILFARRGAQATGLSAIVDFRYEGALCGTGALLLRTNSTKVLSHYLSLYLSSDFAYEWLRNHAVGAVMPNLNTDIIKALPLTLPPMSEQISLSTILGALDDRITLLRETNTTLEAIAQALFKSWFVDFDSVHAKAEGRQPEGMDAATAALFPDSFEESELGLVPRGWRVGSIYDVASVTYGAPFSSKRFNTEMLGLPLIRIRDLKDEQPGVYTEEIHPKGYLTQPGDIVVGMDGEFRSYLWGGEPAWLNQRVCVFKPNAGYSSAFVNYIIKPQLAVIEATEIATTVIHLGKNDIDRFTALIPDARIANAYSDVANPIYEKIVEGKQKAQTLTQLRDTLLPRLISGQLRLPEAEALVEETL